MTACTRGRLARFLSVAALVAGGIFLLLEAAARLWLPVSDIAWYEGDRLVGYRLAPRQAGHVLGDDAVPASFRVNGSGDNNEHEYSASRTPGVFRIAVLGDSYVESLHIGRGRRFFDRLEKDLASAGLPAEVFTYAASGYGTGQELLLLQEEVLEHRPDVVLLLFVANDVPDTACALSSPPDRPCFSLGGDGRLEQRPFVPHAPNRAARVLMRSALLRYVAVNLEAVNTWRRFRGALGPPAYPMSFALDPPPEWREGWTIVERCLEEMARACRARRIPLLVLHQPVISSALAGEIARIPGGGDPGIPGARLKHLAQQAGFGFFDLASALESASNGGAVALLTPHSAHWNDRAQEAVAAALVAPVRTMLAHGGAPGPLPGNP